MPTPVRVAAVQAAPVLLDLEATVDKTCALIAEAAAAGAQVIGFPEAFIPGYPWWIWMTSPDRGMRHYIDLYKNAVEIPSPTVQRLSAAARAAGAVVCVSVTEKEGDSLYLTQLWFGPTGDLLGKHRKMKATGAEMTVWGDGCASMLQAFDTPYGRVGGLQCWEHYIPLNVAAMGGLREDIHVSSWPIGLPDPNHPFNDQQCVNAAEYYAVSNHCFVLLSSQLWTPEQEERICDTPEMREVMEYGHGFTRIIGPNGVTLSAVDSSSEGIAIADIELDARIPVSYIIDTAGHYSTPGNMRLHVDASPKRSVTFTNKQPEGVLLTAEELAES